MKQLDHVLRDRLDARTSKNATRILSPENNLIDFTSNDYLGLARSETLFAAIEEKTKTFRRNGATGSRLLSGNDRYTETVEAKLANIFKTEAALIFNSGYTANLAVLSSLPQRGDTILYDALAHTCMKDGARLSLADRHAFRHNDLNDLEAKLKRAQGKVYIAVESIYSMDGDTCPLIALVALAEKYNASIILDEAHSTGVTGLHGSGMASALGVADRIAVRIYTFGKAMGVHGACVAGSSVLCQYLVNFARPFIYTTALPPHSITAIDESFIYLGKEISKQEELRKKIDLYLRETSGWKKRTNSESAIQTVLIPGNDRVKSVAALLREQGFDVRPIVSPTVAEGSERLRICLHTFNSNDEIIKLSRALAPYAQ